MRRDVHRIQHRSCPISFARVETLSCRRIGEFVGDLAAQPVVEQIRNGDKRFCNIKQRRFLHRHRQQLIKRVDLHELDAGVGKDFRTRTCGGTLPPACHLCVHHDNETDWIITNDLRSSNAKSTPQVSSPMLSSLLSNLAEDMPIPALISDHRRKTSQCNPSGKRTGPLAKRWVSVSVELVTSEAADDGPSAFCAEVNCQVIASCSHD